jgi:hypothetical protein
MAHSQTTSQTVAGVPKLTREKGAHKPAVPRKIATKPRAKLAITGTRFGVKRDRRTHSRPHMCPVPKSTRPSSPPSTWTVRKCATVEPTVEVNGSVGETAQPIVHVHGPEVCDRSPNRSGERSRARPCIRPCTCKVQHATEFTEVCSLVCSCTLTKAAAAERAWTLQPTLQVSKTGGKTVKSKTEHYGCSSGSIRTSRGRERTRRWTRWSVGKTGWSIGKAGTALATTGQLTGQKRSNDRAANRTDTGQHC